MGKTTQKELKLQSDMMEGLRGQGYFADKTSDRFKAGRPDMRVSRFDWRATDFELKYSLDDFSSEADIGATKLQWLKVREMNRHGMPAAFLVYSEPLDLFFVTTLLRETLPPIERRVVKLPQAAGVVPGNMLMNTTMEYLRGLGYGYGSN